MQRVYSMLSLKARRQEGKLVIIDETFIELGNRKISY